ncbi:hypothetical protein [Falsiroseomonas oryzae]|uniref:hypothetical protein n=1 Tax=Falsiroseomonas oryzae TaxID=2766473 RepID=UPI0022EB0E20|nr:hypothetical protein [Roseomonas sp. MO-31]
MFEGLMNWVVASFLLGPIQAEITQRLQAARAPQELVQQVSRCASDALPGLVQRAMSNPAWAVGAVVRAQTGSLQPEALLGDAAPSCPPAIAAVRQHLARRGSAS